MAVLVSRDSYILALQDMAEGRRLIMEALENFAVGQQMIRRGLRLMTAPPVLAAPPALDGPPAATAAVAAAAAAAAAATAGATATLGPALAPAKKPAPMAPSGAMSQGLPKKAAPQPPLHR